MFKRLREEWLYWRYRNITRRWQLLRPRLLRLRRQPQINRSTARMRGTAMYMPTRSSNNRGLAFVAVVAAVLAVVNSFLLRTASPTWPDLIIFAVLAYGYIQYFRV